MPFHDLASLLFSNLAVLLAAMTAVWALSIVLKDASIVDIAWGPACAAPGLATLLRQEKPSLTAMILISCASLWAMRLAGYLWRRNSGHGEDRRYKKMRAAQPNDAAFARWSLYAVFWLQGVVAWIVSLPLQLGATAANPEGAIGATLFAVGAVLFVVGLAFEAIADWQLARFKSNPDNKGALMTEGLWSWTRHPNYFGDAVVWIGFGVMALHAPYGPAGMIGPVVMTFFLVKVSGKAMTERHMRRKYPEYAAYEKRVSGFAPRPPRRSSTP